jgi:hypothetical protein
MRIKDSMGDTTGACDCEYRAGIAVFKTPRQTDTLKAVHDFSLNALEIVKST